MSQDQISLDDIQVDQNNLYIEENITDLKVATIRRLVPIKPDGSPDEGRPVVYMAQTQLMSQMGPLPVQSQIEATSLDEAVQKFPQAIQDAVEKMVEDAKEYRRQESSRIVVPGTGIPGVGGGAPPGGGIISG